jgi:hypothetical protein
MLCVTSTMLARRPVLAAYLLALGCGSSGSTSTPLDAASATDADAVGQDDRSIVGDGASDASGVCPAAQPSGACTDVGLQCGYGCYGCSCQPSGSWYCSAPGCAGGCIGIQNGSPPAEGDQCGGCCGPSVGDTCVYACADGGGHVEATCQGSGTWHVSSCEMLDAADEASCVGLFKTCANDAQCCAPYRCLNITGTSQCQLEGPALDAAAGD